MSSMIVSPIRAGVRPRFFGFAVSVLGRRLVKTKLPGAGPFTAHESTKPAGDTGLGEIVMVNGDQLKFALVGILDLGFDHLDDV